jgi:DNA-binding GntR family transcriptional regulator
MRVGISETARSLGISEIPVRSALQRLAGEGFVKLTPNTGFRVVEHEPAVTAEAQLLYAELWALTGRLAALRGTEADFDELAAIHADSRHAVEDGDMLQFLQIGGRFHRALTRASKSAYLGRITEQVKVEASRGVTHYNPGSDRLLNAYRSHEQTLQALRQRQPERVAQLLRWHVHDSISVADLLAVEPHANDDARGQNDSLERLLYGVL